MILREQPAFLKLIIFGLMMMVSSFIGFGIAYLIEPELLAGGGGLMDKKLFQGVSQIMFFILPTLFMAWLVSSGPKQYYNLHSKINNKHLGLTVLFFVIVLPLIGYTAEWNQGISLPESWSGIEEWMRAYEDRAAAITEEIAFADTIPALLLNLVIMAVIPAIGEELFFRGFAQKYFLALFKNIHVAIWVVAILFSAFHVQFYGFIPRMLMGAALGYTYYWTRNMWFPILFHFLNNAVAVVSYYLYSIGKLDSRPEEVGNVDSIAFIIFLLVGLSYLIYLFHQRRNKDVDWPKQMAEL